MNDFTFLTRDQIFGDDQLGILKKYGVECAMTDFSVLLGGYVSDYGNTSKSNLIKDRIGWWWSKSFNIYNDVECVYKKNGDKTAHGVHIRVGGARPALSYSSISSISSNRKVGRKGVLEVEYGEYPQTIVPEKLARTLEGAYSNGTINQTGKSYTTDSVDHLDIHTPFQARTHIEYEYDGRKYIRFVGDSNCSDSTLSDGRIIKNGDVYWVKVEPIKWLIDKKADIALSKKALFSGVQFNREGNFTYDFNRTNIKEFMDSHFSKDITPSFSREITSEERQACENPLEAKKKELEALKRTLEEKQKLEQAAFQQTTGTGSVTNESNNKHK